MSDRELSDLLEDVEFSSPMRADEDCLEGGRLSPVSSVAKRVLMATEEVKSVMFSEAYNDDIIDPDFLEPSKPESSGTTSIGTSDNLVKSDNKRYKLLLVDEPSEFCGTIMAQGVMLCTNLNCTIKHRSTDK